MGSDIQQVLERARAKVGQTVHYRPAYERDVVSQRITGVRLRERFDETPVILFELDNGKTVGTGEVYFDSPIS